MAYQARGRDPLLDSNMAEQIQKRGKELIGAALIVAGLLAAMMIGSYAPTDPSWLSATDAPVQNWLGQIGASIAAPLFMIVGKGSWSIALILIGWGLRFVLHFGEERALSRIIFLPIAVALCSVFASSLVPGAGWTHAFGLGGLFGDTVLGAFLTFMPLSAVAALKVLALLLSIAAVVVVGFVLGITRVEFKDALRFLAVGVFVTYVMALRLVGKGAVGATRAAGQMQACAQERKAEAAAVQEAKAAQRMTAQPQVTQHAPPMAADPQTGADQLFEDYAEPVEPAEPKERTGLLARMPSLIKRAEPQPQVAEEVSYVPADYADLPVDDRIKSKITDVIKSRVRRPAPAPVQAAPVSSARRGPTPLVVDTAQPRMEPPLTSAMTATASLVHSGAGGAAQAGQSGLAIHSARIIEAPELAAQSVAPANLSYAEPGAPTEQMMHPAQSYAPVQRETGYEQTADLQRYAEDYAPAERLPESSAAPAYADAPSFESAPQVAEIDLAQYAAPEAPLPKAEPAKRVVQHTPKKILKPSTRAKAEAQPVLKFDDSGSDFELPPLNLLESPVEIQRLHLSDESLEENARMLESVLDDYGVKGEITSVRPGPVVTMYELEPAPGLKASRVIGLSDDIARSMSALSARVSTVPGRSVIGIELPNEHREKVVLREILASRDFGDGTQKLPLALGKDIGGDPVVANLAKMPHLLIAGTTGSGKSVAINTMILSLLYKLTPEDCRLIMIDPKMLELSVYDGIPHLLSPVVTDPKKAVVALKWVVGEMEERYRKMSKMGVRNIDGYNGRVADAKSRDEMFSRTVQTGFDDETGEPIFETEEFAPEKMPYIVVIVDEMADLMMVAGKEIEACIQRLAQMARASGIHLIMATQRPSVDVITGTIKANFPTRISFQVTSKIDSRTILGEMGAEQLLGMGDMLYMAGGAKITRCHGPFVSDEEVEEIVNHLKAFGPPSYMSGVVEGPEEGAADGIDAVLGLSTGGNTDGEDALYDTAVQIVIKDRKCSTSYIQRKLAIGYNKAARLVEQMEDEGLVSPANHVGKREILVPEQ
jgi:S-DNA-T family DNA segregation ATPase FtsK/SpoIIIE